ncbi:MAG: universal stress protein [Desulfobacteraceae bacterium]|nr:universal stress protein [Desulfobacteraceae bacterium]
MYKKILVPLDGSPRAEKILPHVEDIALLRKAKILLLQVVRLGLSGGELTTASIQAHLDDFKKRSDQALHYLDGIGGEFREKGIQVKKMVESGPVVETILRIASQESVDLVAMASHGRGGLYRVFYGSVAAGVLHRIDRPLLLVRTRNV